MKKKIHFIGIGGIGMSAIARILNCRGHEVTGSDEKDSSIIRDMQREGIRCFIGHKESNVGDCDIAVYSSCIKENNAELAKARRRGIAVMHRAEMLREVINGKKNIAITGTHGKTTTTALTALIFKEAGMEPQAAIGGEALNFHSNALCGKGDYFIIEADESDGSFLRFNPDFTVMLNIDREHLDYFGTLDNAINIYRRFAENTGEGGTVYYNADDRYISDLLKDYHGRKVSFGVLSDSDVKAADVEQRGLAVYFRCIIKGETMPGEIVFPMPGCHNATNALAAIAVAYDAGIDFKKIKDAIRSYKGTKRRFQIMNTSGGAMLVEDYAHHPTEIEAVLAACGPLKKNRIVVFQPHRYTRTKDLFREFVDCFKSAEHLILTDIYAASENAIKGVSTEELCRRMKQNGVKNVEYMKKDAISKRLKEMAGKDDIVLILGAGDINEITKELL